MIPSTCLVYWGFKMWAWDNWMIAKAPLRCWTTGEVLQGLTLQLMAESKIPMLKYQSLHGPLYNAGLQGKLDKEEGGVCPSKVSNWTARDWVATEMAWLTRESPQMVTKRPTLVQGGEELDARLRMRGAVRVLLSRHWTWPPGSPPW